MTNKSKLAVFWCRRDFRLTDNAALFRTVEFAKENNCLFLPVFCLDSHILDSQNLGCIRKEYLAVLLKHFAANFTQFALFFKPPQTVFEHFSSQFELVLFANEDIEPYSQQRDDAVKEIVEKNGGQMRIFTDQISVDKDILTGSANFYSVFTPFKKAVWNQFLAAGTYPKIEKEELSELNYLSNWQEIANKFELSFLKSTQEISNLIAATDNLLTVILHKKSPLGGIHNFLVSGNSQEVITFTETKLQLNLTKLGINPSIDGWYQNEDEALTCFDRFNDERIWHYKENRDNLESEGGTSQMSVALKWGLVSPRTLKNRVLEKYKLPRDSSQAGGVNITPETASHPLERGTGTTVFNPNLEHYLSELIWREFYRYILYHKPTVLQTEYQTKFYGKISWVEDETGLERFLAWIKGQTGYPLVDAAMQQVAQTGWMHNRSRMLTASVLTKNLGVDWRWGQDYFRAVLLDLDEANNNGGWQWAASTGADPKPIRIFNPYLQTEKYDKDYKYQLKWLPKDYLEKMSSLGGQAGAKKEETDLIDSQPSNPLFNQETPLSPQALSQVQPIIDHKQARIEALKRYGLAKDAPARDY